MPVDVDLFREGLRLSSVYSLQALDMLYSDLFGAEAGQVIATYIDVQKRAFDHDLDVEHYRKMFVRQAFLECDQELFHTLKALRDDVFERHLSLVSDNSSQNTDEFKASAAEIMKRLGVLLKIHCAMRLDYYSFPAVGRYSDIYGQLDNLPDVDASHALGLQQILDSQFSVPSKG